ncbi:MAG: nucleotide exchange factor GrpE [Anaerolineae bacterium]|nr:nucleotide exchange factor GrpE [Anaerolineae bacterium]
MDLATLEKQVGKLGREQFKLNTLIELLQQQSQAAQQQLSEQIERHDTIVADLRASYALSAKADVAEARLQTALQVLPVLDGLEEAISSGERLLERQTQFAARYWPTEHDSVPQPTSLLLSLPSGLADLLTQRASPLGEIAQQPTQMAIFDHAELAAMQAAYAAGLAGLGMIRARLLDTLAREGVQPLETLGRRFDPNRHMALEVVLCDATHLPGYVVSEIRRGYVCGDRVLRYAEVVVARQRLDAPAPVDANESGFEDAGGVRVQKIQDEPFDGDTFVAGLDGEATDAEAGDGMGDEAGQVDTEVRA